MLCERPAVLQKMQDKKGRRRGWPWLLLRWLLGVVLPIRIALVSSMLRNSSRRDPRAWEISGFSEARVLLRNSEPYFFFFSLREVSLDVSTEVRERRQCSRVLERGLHPQLPELHGVFSRSEQKRGYLQKKP